MTPDPILSLAVRRGAEQAEAYAVESEEAGAVWRTG